MYETEGLAKYCLKYCIQRRKENQSVNKRLSRKQTSWNSNQPTPNGVVYYPYETTLITRPHRTLKKMSKLYNIPIFTMSTFNLTYILL